MRFNKCLWMVLAWLLLAVLPAYSVAQTISNPTDTGGGVGGSPLG